MPEHTYNNGQPYLSARGRYSEQVDVENRWRTCHPIITGRPSVDEFVGAIERELKIRAYQPNTVRTYVSNLRMFLNWFGGKPNLVTRESVRRFLLMLVDGGAKGATLSVYLAAIRTAFDKFCGRDVTLGLATPRKSKYLPVVPSRNELKRILKSAISRRDKLLIGLMYATGARVSEVAALRWEEIDFDRNLIVIRNGKGRVHRTVFLPESFRPLLRRLSELHDGRGFVFEGARKGKYLSPRTIQRIVSETVRLAGISKRITPHCFRHAFATHLLECGTDIRFIQSLLGHMRLETTTIYTKIAKQTVAKLKSPADQLLAEDSNEKASSKRAADCGGLVGGRLRVEIEPQDQGALAHLRIRFRGKSFKLNGIAIRENRNGWMELELPAIDDWVQAINVQSGTKELVERIKSVSFYEWLRQEILAKYISAGSGVREVAASTY